MKRPACQNGFTLTELMIVVAITGMLTTAMYQLVQSGQRSSSRSRVLVELQQNARVGMQSLGDDLRAVSYGKDPTQPSIAYAGPDSVVFMADIDFDSPGAERIAYFLSPDGDPDTENPDDTILMRVVADTSGNVLVSAPQSYGIQGAGLHFDWFNGSGTELENPVPQPEEVGEIFVTLTAAGSRELDGEYPVMTLSTTIYPRNLPLSPARSRPSTPACSGPTYPNCESATITWNAPTTNTDGTTLDPEDIAYFNFYTGTDPDALSLYTRLARTLDTWTVNSLEADQTHYLGVTCVSRSGVESFCCTRTAYLSSTLVPVTPGMLGIAMVPGSGANLTWYGSSTFTNGDPITTPVTYHIYRGTETGFPTDANHEIGTVTYSLTYTDDTMENCFTYYYAVTAEACGNESNPTNEAWLDFPSPPAAPSGIACTGTGTPGEVTVSWTRPALRMDTTDLDPLDVQGSYVYLDTVPNPTSYVEVLGSAETVTISNLANCKTYYVNVRCIDSCGHLGDLNPAGETTFNTVAPCDMQAPSAPSTLSLTPDVDRVTLQWPANTVDCDLAGYQVFYGNAVGGPYSGTGALEGNSPITVFRDDVTTGDVCSFQLTGLPSCTQYAVRVSAVDLCEPPNASAYSPEAAGITTCLPCNITDACTIWAVDGTGNTNLHLELYSTSGQTEALTRLTPTFAGGGHVREVWFGSPLSKIWAHDGTAGQDGNVGPQASGVELNLTDVSVPTWTRLSDGIPLQVVFDSDVRGLGVDLSMKGNTGTCAAGGTGNGTVLIDDWNDGNYTSPAWTVVNGSWSVVSGELKESTTNANCVLRASGSLTDGTIQCKVQSLGSGSTHSIYIVYRYQSSSNYGIFGIRTDTDQVRAARISGGVFTQTQSYGMALNDGQWYTLKVVLTGKRVEGYIDCTKVIDVTDASLWTTGGLGLTTRNANGLFDDYVAMSGTELP